MQVSLKRERQACQRGCAGVAKRERQFCELGRAVALVRWLFAEDESADADLPPSCITELSVRVDWSFETNASDQNSWAQAARRKPDAPRTLELLSLSLDSGRVEQCQFPQQTPHH
jgi:hypothetical protein